MLQVHLVLPVRLHYFIAQQGMTVTGDIDVTGKVVASLGFEPASCSGTGVGTSATSFNRAYVGFLDIGSTWGDSIVHTGGTLDYPDFILKSDAVRYN